ncbi:hypothetical protein FE697_018685 [Mumia zhuanghuii]|uniref:DoxX family protein n=2 Tax=Mumia TaxID=1546255 RepID=A0ABW1QLZ6_9ACTN|nr:MULTISPECIES: DoxX family protein [Mumia]KAA1419924.1 hypothetical protein FE697_018685 [Mumia zhuanghuii]
MSSLPDPVWPVLVLAVIQLADAVFCVKPLAFVRECLTDVRFPRRWWPVLTPLKLAAAAGLVAGIWVPYLGLVTTFALIAYFLVAIGAHLRARDLGRNLFMNAIGMLVICVGVAWVSFA